jgi:ATP-binding cassette, subfamily C, bacterial PrsD
MTRPGQNKRLASDQLRKLRGSFLGIGVFSGCINVLMLAGSLYMLQVYDRVLTSRSIPTLIGISLILLAAFILQGVLDTVRTRMLARTGAQFDEALSPTIFDMMRKLPLRGARSDQSMQGVRDLDTVRGFLGGMGPTAFFDMPFMPIFFIGCFLLHPSLGVLALIGGVVIVGLTLWTERLTKKGTLALTATGSERLMLAEASRRNAEALQAMGMGAVFQERWRKVNTRFVETQLSVSDASNSIGSAAKIFRMAFQSAVLGFGAYLVILQQMSPGAMIAASILTSRALAPIETAVAHWKGFVASRQSIERLNDLMASAAAEPERTELPEPKALFTAEDLAVGIPGRQSPVVMGANLQLKGGEGLLLIGPSGSGKSTLVRSLAGVWPLLRGSVRLDGAALDQWDPQQLGRHVGYMPQDVELFEGTIAENIARFIPDANDEEIVAAAKAAGAHDLILKFAAGYDTRLGESGMTLSGGQRQRVGLARAMFRDPFLLILDEPNSNLDADGETALVEAVSAIRARGGVVIIVSHKTSLMNVMDYVGRVHDGRLHIITRDEYRQNLMKAAQASQPVHTPQGQAAAVRNAPHPFGQQQNRGPNVQQQVALLQAATANPGPAAKAASGKGE